MYDKYKTQHPTRALAADCMENNYKAKA